MSIQESDLIDAMGRGRLAAYRWLGSTNDVEDACQEAIRKAWESRDRFEAGRPFYPWFYRILRNVCIDRLNHRRRSTDIANQMSAQSPASHPANVEEKLILNDRQQLLYKIITQLSETHRSIIEMRHFDDLSYEEIALILDLPMGTVMSRLYRARKELRILIEETRR